VENDHLYIVMELAASDLNALIENKKRTGARISEDTIWSYFIQMCVGLQYLHSQDIMHRVCVRLVCLWGCMQSVSFTPLPVLCG
jgi:hypothetical protein